MRFYRQNEEQFTRENIKVSISVDSRYWFNKIERTLQDLADLYNSLFPAVASQDGVVSKETDLKARAVTDISARQLWRSIRDNPQSPPGPLTLAAISLAMLLGANFADPRDRRVFFEFMEHNEDFQKFFLWGMQDQSARPNADDRAEKLLVDLRSEVQTPEEALRLAQIWGELHEKIGNASKGENSEFYTELFKFAPTVARRYSNTPGVEPSLKWIALQYPGVVAAAALGFEKSPGYLSQALVQEDIEQLLTQKMCWVNVYMSDEWVSGRYDMWNLYPEHPLDTAAFIAQLEPSKLDLSATGPFSDKFELDKRPEEFILPGLEDVNKMFEKIGALLNNAIGYFFLHRPADINNLFGKMANARFSSYSLENSQDLSRHLELRYRLYHPATIKAMAGFWLQNFESFKIAAGENDEYLGHLLRHMPDPANFMMRMLQKKSADPRKNDQAERWAYFAPRFAKILPAIAKTVGTRGEEKLRALLVKKIKRRGKEYVFKGIAGQTKQLVDHYARHFQDPDEQLLAVLDEKVTRSCSFGTAEQITQCLNSKTPGDPKTVNSRFEVIIAGDDRLFAKVLPPAHNQIEKFKVCYPTLWARFTISEAMDEGGLRAYVENPEVLSVREAFVIATNESYWHEIDPYTRHPVRAFFDWLIPGSQKNFFNTEQSRLASKNPILAMRMDWRRDQSKRFEQFLVGKQEELLDTGFHLQNWSIIRVRSDELRREFTALFADLGRGSDLFELYKGGDLAVPQNLCRARAFLAEVNTPSKVSLAYDFILKIDPANIDADSVFRLMIRDESPTDVEKASGKTCFELAKCLIYNNNALLPEIIALHMKQINGLSPELIARLGSLIIDRNLQVGYQGSSGTGCDQIIRGMIADGDTRRALSADDLLRIRNVSQPVFNELMQSDNRLRQKLAAHLEQMSGDELAKVGVMGLGVLFREAPECLYSVLCKMPSVDAPEGLSGGDKDDIFKLKPQTLFEEYDLSNLPLFTHMMKQDLGSEDNVNLMMKCLNSTNLPLVKLMRQVLSRTLQQGDPTLLLKFLEHKQSTPRLVDSILAEAGTLKDEIRSLFLSANFVSHLSYDKKTEQFPESATKLWSVLLKSQAVMTFINKGLPFKDPNKQIRSAANQWNICYGLFEKRAKERAKSSAISVRESAGQRMSFNFGGTSGVSSIPSQEIQLK